MDLKKTERGLSISLDDPIQSEPLSAGLSRGLIALALAVGLWGMGGQLLDAAVLTAALVVLLPAMLLSWRKRAGLFVLAGGGVLALLLGLIFRTEIGSGLGAIYNAAAGILTEQTGYYYHNVLTGGNTLAGSVAVGVLLALAVTGMVRGRTPVVTLVVSALVFWGWSLQLLQGNGFLALFLLGVALVLAKEASGSGKAVFWAAGLIGVLMGMALLVCGLSDYEPARSAELDSAVHHWRYEQAEQPLPEGELDNVGRFDPGSDTALEITMESWQGLYLRGFVGSRYTGSGWEEESCGTLAENAQLLYSLQTDYFHPFAQLAAAQEALEEETDNTISVKTLNACRAYAYLPYGIGGVNLDGRRLTEPEGTEFSGSLYPVEDAYLVQKELSDGGGTAQYLAGESAYRSWVYSQYLQVPEQVSTLLESSLGSLTEPVSSSQIKERVLSWLHETLTYDEYASTRAGDTDLAQYLLEVSPYGYSVHYATLGTLAMRALGIPARYVEGYIVPKALASTMADGQTLSLSMEYAHAWVEYYLDGVGWVPFEVTPKYEGEMNYQLPPDGTGVQNPQTIDPPDQDDPEEPPVKQEPDPAKQARVRAVKLASSILALLLLLLAVALAIRSVLRRRKLKKRLGRFQEEGSRKSMLDCLSYQYELLELMGLPKRNVPIMKLEQDVSQLLLGENVRPVLLLAQELSFSDHPVTPEQHKLVLAGLDRVKRAWKQATPGHKRIWQSWIQCRVL